MSIVLREAISEADLLAAYRLRYAGFVGQGILDHDRPDEMIYDLFDAMPTTTTVVAERDGVIVGTTRYTSHRAERHPCDDWIDWRARVPDGLIGSGSMTATVPGRPSGLLGLRLVDAAMNIGVEDGCTHGVAAVTPEIVPLFERLQWEPLGESFRHPLSRLPVVPMVVDLAHRRVLSQRSAALPTAS